MYNITFQQIKAFLTTARYLNLSRSAKEMFISQPALSKMLQRFEEGVGVTLFDRSNHGVTLTPEGEYLQSTLEVLYYNMEKTIRMAASQAVSKASSLRIAEASSYDMTEAFDELKQYVREFERRYPDVVILESVYDIRELRRGLEIGSADLVFSQDFAIANMQDISFKKVSSFEVSLTMSAQHPLAQAEQLSVKQLEKETFFVVEAGSAFDEKVISSMCRRMGFLPKAVQTAQWKS